MMEFMVMACRLAERQNGLLRCIGERLGHWSSVEVCN